METIITVGNFAERLASTPRPLPSGVAKTLPAFLLADAQRVADSFRALKRGELASAVATERQVREDAVQNHARLNAAGQTLGALARGSWTMGIVSLICFLVASAADYVLNAAVVPWLVSVSKASLLGVALSLAPTTVPVILDRVLAGVFDVEDTWEAVKSAVLSPANLVVRRTVRVLFLAFVGALNLYAIWLLGTSRGVASFLLNHPDITAMTDSQQTLIDLSLVVLSVAVAVDAALFYLFGLHELRRAADAFQARRQVRRLRQKQEELQNALSKATSSLTEREWLWSEIDRYERSVMASYIAEQTVALEQAIADPGPAVEPRQIVQNRLTRLAASGLHQRAIQSADSTGGEDEERVGCAAGA